MPNFNSINNPPSQFNQQSNEPNEAQNVKSLGIFYEEDPNDFTQNVKTLTEIKNLNTTFYSDN